jgi:hypothetical protein
MRNFNEVKDRFIGTLATAAEAASHPAGSPASASSGATATH